MISDVKLLFPKLWKWKEQSGDRIYKQLRRLGSSYDWDRARFSMDEMLSRAVTEAFIRLYDQQLIYRSTRLVNWCPTLKTAISNLEVDYKELTGRTLMTVPNHGETLYEFGVLVMFAYPVEQTDLEKKSGAKPEEIIVATFRIETMLGDVAVAVNPEDPRYKHLQGRFVRHPFIVDRRLPVIMDKMVDINFGTGAVKITPAHDFNDFECGNRHKLPFINILTEDGCINDVGGERFRGMKRFDARVAIISALKEMGLHRDTINHAINLPICSRTGDLVEPMLKPQWFVSCETLAQKACDVVRSGELEIIPAQFEKTWFSWMENLNDWCISRQLWWGHRIPAYAITINGESVTEDAHHWIAAHDEVEALKRACERFSSVAPERIHVRQGKSLMGKKLIVLFEEEGIFNGGGFIK